MGSDPRLVLRSYSRVVLTAGDHLGMSRRKNPLKNRERTSVQLGCLFSSFLILYQYGKVIQCHCHVGMIRTEKLFFECQGTAVGGFRLRWPSCRMIHSR